jgi:hypothetical protein
LVVAGVLVAGCGDDDGVPPAAAPSTTPVTAPSPPSTAAPGAPTACSDDGRDELDGNAAIDWADLVQLDGRQYQRPSDGRSVDAAQLGEVVGVVCFTLDAVVSNPDYRMIDGDATFLPIGTELRSVPGIDPRSTVAALVDGEVRVYDLFEIVDAVTAGGSLELDRPLARITIVEPVNGELSLTVDDPAELEALVVAVRDAPIDPTFDPSALQSDHGYVAQFVRVDGTTVSRFVWNELDVMEPGIALPQPWIDLIDTVDGLAPASPDGVGIVAVYDDVGFYGACGNNTLDWDGVVYYQLFPEEFAALDVSAYPTSPPPTTAPAMGFARVPAPGPGDDVGTLIVYADGLARFESGSGNVDWLSTEPHEYDWVC